MKSKATRLWRIRNNFGDGKPWGISLAASILGKYHGFVICLCPEESSIFNAVGWWIPAITVIFPHLPNWQEQKAFHNGKSAYKTTDSSRKMHKVDVKRSSNTNRLSISCQWSVEGLVYHRGRGVKLAEYQGWSDPGGKELATQNHYERQFSRPSPRAEFITVSKR